MNIIAGYLISINSIHHCGDALGSVCQLADLSGAITYSRAYDPGVYPERSRRGVVTSTTGTSSTTYGYTGEAYGESTQLTYLRSRYYASGTGRFLTRDTWMGDANSPMSFNRWAYVNGSPINLTDPSGNHPGDHSKYCVPLTGDDRLSCESIVRGISPTAHVPLAEMRIYDAASIAGDDCYFWEHLPTARVLSHIDSLTSLPLPEQHGWPHRVYGDSNGVPGTWKEYGWWWHYLLDITPGWWNNYGQGHAAISDVIALALGVELSIMADNSQIQRYAAAAFATKAWSDGFYKMIGSRQSVFTRVNTALYGPTGAGSYNFNEYGSSFNEIFTADSDYNLQTNVRHLGREILLNTGFSADERKAYEWGNPTDRTPESFLSALRYGNMGPNPTNVLYFNDIWRGKDHTPWGLFHSCRGTPPDMGYCSPKTCFSRQNLGINHGKS